VQGAVQLAEETKSTTFNLNESCPENQQSKHLLLYKMVHITIKTTYQILWEGKKKAL
jgi:hypothetical protein